MLKSERFKAEVENSFSNRYLNLILFPTEKCNFRCTYCYEDFKIGKMKKSVVESLKRLLDLRLPTLDHIEFSWFGGEPLLASAIIKEIHEYAYKIKNEHTLIGGNISTNGYLLKKELFEELVRLGLTKYQISLDGIEDAHDKSRLLINGNGTFKQIWSNLINCKSINRDFEIVLRLHYSKSTFRKLIPLIEEINKEFKNDSRFKVYLKSIENLGGPYSESIEETELSDKAKIEEILNQIISKEVNKFNAEKDAPSICYASKPNSIAIRADGRISKCTVALDSDSNLLGEINEDGTLNINNKKLQNWFVGFESKNLKTLACPLNQVIKKTTANKQDYERSVRPSE